MTTISETNTTVYISQNEDNIVYSIGSTGSTSYTITWPVTVTNTDPLVESMLNINFYTDITINNITGGTSAYFTCESSYINYEGNSNTVNLSGLDGYLGLIRNGTTADNAYPYVSIKNIIINSINSSQGFVSEIGSGLLTYQYFGNGTIIDDNLTCTVENCGTTGTLKIFNINFLNGYGGLIGSFSTAYAKNCFNNIVISNQASGGIFGSNSFFSIAENCINQCIGASGSFTDNSGGIFGSRAGHCTAINCIIVFKQI